MSVRLPTTPIGPRHFAVLRILLGLYLVIHFAFLLPYAADLFSSAGMVEDARVNLSYGYFPNPLNVLDSPGSVRAFVALLVVGSLALVAGYRPVWLPILLWFGWACLLNRNVFIRNPSMPYIGWILLATAMVPRGEAWALDRRRADWHFPRRIFIALWVLLALGYALSGIDKAGAPSWQDGTALSHVLSNPLARGGWLGEWLLERPAILVWGTWAALALEIAFAPLCVSRRLRPFVWTAMVSMQIGILVLVDFADLTWGMLVVHAWTFDPAWLARFRRAPVGHTTCAAGSSGLTDSPDDITHDEISGDRT